RCLAGPQDARGDQLQDELAAADLDSVAGVVAALVARDDVEVLREEVDDLAFAFVTPLRAHNDDVAHGMERKFLVYHWGRRSPVAWHVVGVAHASACRAEIRLGAWGSKLPEWHVIRSYSICFGRYPVLVRTRYFLAASPVSCTSMLRKPSLGLGCG